MMLLQNPNSRLLDETGVRWIASMQPLKAPGLVFYQRTATGVYVYERPRAMKRIRSDTANASVWDIPEGFGFNTLLVGAHWAQNLIVADAYYPGWRAFVDGRPAPIKRHEVFREVALDGKPGRVWMVYYPSSVVAGIFLGLFSLSALATILVGGGPTRTKKHAST
jgi:hypothetical protein